MKTQKIKNNFEKRGTTHDACAQIEIPVHRGHRRAPGSGGDKARAGSAAGCGPAAPRAAAGRARGLRGRGRGEAAKGEELCRMQSDCIGSAVRAGALRILLKHLSAISKSDIAILSLRDGDRLFHEETNALSAFSFCPGLKP